MTKVYYDNLGREIKGFFKLKGKTIPIKEKLPTIYHGGREDDYDTMAAGHKTPGIIFCTDNESQAFDYGIDRGAILHSYKIKPKAKMFTYDLEGSSYKDAYQYVEDESNWTPEELEILTRYSNNPLAALAYVYQRRGYDILKIKNVIDHPKPGKGMLDLTPTNDYIILNKEAVIPLKKDKIR